MKLIDLLVQELPKRGGWVHGVKHAWCDPDGEVRFRDGGCKPDFYPEAEVDDECRIPSYRHEDDPHYIVTREQYEAAIAAAQQPVWDGEGLPPVGCECEGRFILGAEWFFFRCVAVDCGIAFGWAGKDAVTLDKGSYEFRPIRSEDDKRRDEAIAALVDFKIGYHSYPKAAEEYLREVTALYDAILRGEIPHIRIEQAA